MATINGFPSHLKKADAEVFMRGMDDVSRYMQQICSRFIPVEYGYELKGDGTWRCFLKSWHVSEPESATAWSEVKVRQKLCRMLREARRRHNQSRTEKRYIKTPFKSKEQP